MALIFPDAKMLYEARLRGASFGDTLTIAHLSLFLHPAELQWLREAHQRNNPAQAVPDALGSYRWGEESDRFLRDVLGVNSLEILDNSAYERATFIHDLNQPVPESHRGRFDAVIDAGSLEHVFNVPVALANLMNMVKVGGNLFITTPSNNMCGHGFYQFSPELFFRVFTEANGFRLRRVAMLECRYPSIELVPVRRCYVVSDPAEIRRRVGLLSRRPALIQVEATKVAQVTPFSSCPQQSDYVAAWKGREAQVEAGSYRFAKRLARKLPRFIRNHLLGSVESRRFSFRDKASYRRL